MSDRGSVKNDPPYETKNLPLRHGGLGFGAFALMVAIPLVALTLFYFMFMDWSAMTPRERAIPPHEGVTEAPTLQVSPSADLATFRMIVNARLGSTGWVDRKKGIAHIPIDEAMKLSLKREGGEGTHVGK